MIASSDMLTEELSDLIRLLYESVSDAANWPSFLTRFAQCTRASSTAFVAHDFGNAAASLAVSMGIDPAAQREYEEYYARQNAWVQARPDLFMPGVVVPADVAVPDAELVKTEFYNDYLRPNAFFYSCGGTILKENGVTSYLTALRPRSGGAFGEAEVELLERLMPHLQTALRLHGKLAQAVSRAAAVAEALEKIARGVVIVDQDAKPLEMNRAARSIVALADGLTISDGRLRASTAIVTQRLRTLIYGAANTHSGGGPGGVLNLPRRSGKRALEVLVAPLLPSASGLTTRVATAVVFIEDPAAATAVDREALAQLFGLTRAESRIAVALLNGDSPDDAAAALQISPNTARTHVKRLLAKTGTKRQGDLIRLLLTSPAAMTAGPK